MAILNYRNTGFSWPRGDSLPFDLEFKDENDVPVNITGWSVYFTLKRNKNDVDIIISKTITDLTDPINGKITFTISAIETNALLGVYYYDCDLITTQGSAYAIVSGTITFLQDITRRIEA
jgi:hypothetical protein